MVRRVVQVGGVTWDCGGEDREGLRGQDDDDICEGWDERDAPDQCNQSVGSLHRADLKVMQRSAHRNVPLDGHAGQVQRAVPGNTQRHN